MKITAIEPFVCDGGLRQFGFLKVSTDEGIVGWAETYDFTANASLATALRIIGQEFIGQDPRRIELFNERMWYLARPGIPERIKVLAALDIAFYDIKGKWLGVPAYELLGGRFRDRIPLYWSHFASYRAVWPEVVGHTAPQFTYRDWAEGARDVVAQGYKVLKTNLVQEPKTPGERPHFPTYRDGWIDRHTLDEAQKWIGTIRDVVGPDIGISLDVQFDYRMGGIVQLARAMEPFNLYWLEVEDLDPDALLSARKQTTTRFCHGESLFRRDQFRPFFQKHVTDVVMIETLSNGVTETRRIAEMAELYDVMVSPHNWMSPLGTMINAQLCAALPNVEILEIDLDDVPWKMDLLTDPFEIENGALIVPDRPGWGTEIDEAVIRAHPLPPEKLGQAVPRAAATSGTAR
ncbi:MAG TPA: mandelate racemase/muconate lactonizing enzyme family protein [Candidatus Saccharimonadales bacterium]|nr:mandelate racemase/muconate lactonizing enzyme family protein [Candidatus Saccharimonadales bacterium]